MLPPLNRPGNILGQHGRTIDDLYHLLIQVVEKLEAIDGHTVGVLSNVANMADAIGYPSSTDCGVPVLELLCGIATELGVVIGPGGSPPPATCPGFSESPTAWLYAGTWYLTETELTGPTGNAAPNFTTVGAPPDIAVADFFPNPGDELYRLHKITTTLDLMNLCLSWQGKTEGYQIIANVYNSSDDSIAFSTVLALQTDSGVGSETWNMDADQYAVIQASIAGDVITVPPEVEIWVVEGPVG